MAAGKDRRMETRKLVLMGLLTALEIVLSRFLSIPAWNMKIGLAFIPVVLAAVLYGAAAAGTVGALGDLIGAMLFPIGPYFPGFTLTAALTGAVYGILLRREQTLWRVLAAVGINQFVLSLGMNTLWISLLYGSSFTGLLPARLIQCAILAPVQVAVILLIARLRGSFSAKEG